MNIKFDQELTELINKYSIDEFCGLPDYMLAEFIKHILQDLSYFKVKKTYDIQKSNDFFGRENFE